MDSNIIVALIGIVGAFFGFFASTLKDFITSKNAAKQKWLDDRKTAYIKFISSFSKPYSSTNVDDYFKNLVEASTEAYLYGNISPITPLLIPSPIPIFLKPMAISEAEKNEMVMQIQRRFKGLDFGECGLEEDQEIDSLLSLIQFLSCFRPLFSSDRLRALKKEGEESAKAKDELEAWLQELRSIALAGFMPKFLIALS